MSSPSGTQRVLDDAPPVFDTRSGPLAARPGSAPMATTIVLFTVVAALLGFIAWL